MADQIDVVENELDDGTKQKLIIVLRNPNDEFDKKMTVGDKLADNVAKFGGSWKFIIISVVFLAFWALTNGVLLSHGFDPYPFVFLNLILSMVAALQAPIIMMSQNRQSEKDRSAAQSDFEINCKAESGILGIHEKLDTGLADLNQKIDDLIKKMNDKPVSENQSNVSELVKSGQLEIDSFSKKADTKKISLSKNPTSGPKNLRKAGAKLPIIDPKDII